MLKNARWFGLGAALALGTIVLPLRVLGETSGPVATGQIEGPGPVMSLGVAAEGTVSEILAHAGDHVQAGAALVKLDCRIAAADVRAREARLAAAQATFDRVHNGSRPDEIVVGEAVVGYSAARADEAKKTLTRTEALQEGVTVSTARVLEVQRDSRIAAAQLEEARARLSLLRAGSREEDIRQAQALRDAASAELDETRARLDQCTVRAPAAGTVVDVLANAGQFFSSALPQPLLRMVQDGPARIRVEADLRDAARFCVSQGAAVISEAFPSAAIHAQVVSVSPLITPPRIAAASDKTAKDVLPVVLALDPGAPPLPIGSAVTVHFEACPSKT
jgi:HlyD family secretion protein